MRLSSAASLAFAAARSSCSVGSSTMTLGTKGTLDDWRAGEGCDDVAASSSPDDDAWK